MQFPNASGIPMNMLFPTDVTFCEKLAKFLEVEPAQPSDFPMRGMAAAVGIIKGQPFQPDARTRTILGQAAAVASKMTRYVALRTPDEAPETRVYPDRMWQKNLRCRQSAL
jgi:hypothetical protein